MPKDRGSSSVGSNLANHHQMSGGDPDSLGLNHDGENQRLPLVQCRKVFGQRDFSHGLVVKFSARMPEELQTYLDEATFEQTVRELNGMYEEAEKVGTRSAAETLVGCFTCYLSQLCLTSQYETMLRRIARYLREQNESVYMPKGLFITDPIERGLRVLEISILTEAAAPPRLVSGGIQPIQQPPLGNSSHLAQR